MKKLLLAFLLVGCASTVCAGPRVPAFLTGEWVRSDYKASKAPNAEPEAGSAIYLLENGSAMVWCPEVGDPCSATYQEKKGILRLKEVQVDSGPFTPIIAHYTYDPKTRTLRLLQSKPPESVAMLKLEVYTWRRAEVPRIIRQALRQP